MFSRPLSRVNFVSQDSTKNFASQDLFALKLERLLWSVYFQSFDAGDERRSAAIKSHFSTF